MSVFDLLVKTATAFGSKTAAVHLERDITYEALLRDASTLSERLKKLQLEPGSRVAVLCENSIEYLISFFAVFGAGLVAVPVDTSLAADNVRFILADADAQVLLVQGKFRRQLKALKTDDLDLKLVISDKPIGSPVPDLPFELLADILSGELKVSDTHLAGDKSDDANASDELAAIFYTSGSTGVSKGVMLSHRNLISNTLATVEYLGLSSEDSVLVILPFYYIYGNSLLLTHVACGGHVVIDNQFMYPELVMDTLEQSKVTGFAGVPSTFMIALTKSTLAKRKLEHLRYITQAGGAMAPEVSRRLMAACPKQDIWVMYGQTEASPRVTYLPPERLEEKLGSIGIPVPGVEVRLVDDSGAEVGSGETGEIAVGGPNVMLGYWKQPEETREVIRDGWLFTGDLARVDDDGYLYIVGRKREIIKSSGHRVSAKEIEETILEYEPVAEVAIVGVPDDVLGEAIVAVAVLKSGEKLADREIQAWCLKRLAPFKVPRQVLFMEELPKYGSGKTNKLELKERIRRDA